MRYVLGILLIAGCAKPPHAVEQYRYTPSQPHNVRPQVETKVVPPQTHPDKLRISGDEPTLTAEARKAKVSGIVTVRFASQ